MQEALGQRDPSSHRQMQHQWTSGSKSRHNASEQLWQEEPEEDEFSACGQSKLRTAGGGNLNKPELSFTDCYQGSSGNTKSAKDVTKIAKKGVETVQEIVTEFILFVTSEACDLAKDENRHTIRGDDVLKALQKLGFDSYHKEVNHLNDRLQETIKMK